MPCETVCMWQWLMNGINTRTVWRRHPWIYSVSNVTFRFFSPAVALPLWTTAGSGFGISQSSRLSSSVSAMRVLNTGSDVEEALADALVWQPLPIPTALHFKKNQQNTSQAVTLCNSHFQECVHACVFVRVCVTNPWFYLCLMLSAVGRHAVQGQILLLLLTCMLYVCVSVRACV